MERKTLSVRIPAQKHAQLVKLAAEYDVSIADVVRWAIAAYLDKEQEVLMLSKAIAEEATDGE